MRWWVMMTWIQDVYECRFQKAAEVMHRLPLCAACMVLQRHWHAQTSMYSHLKNVIYAWCSTCCNWGRMFNRPSCVGAVELSVGQLSRVQPPIIHGYLTLSFLSFTIVWSASYWGLRDLHRVLSCRTNPASGLEAGQCFTTQLSSRFSCTP